jgi:hypothetical protein
MKRVERSLAVVGAAGQVATLGSLASVSCFGLLLRSFPLLGLEERKVSAALSSACSAPELPRNP